MSPLPVREIVAIAEGRRRALARNAATAVLLLVLTGAGLAFGHLNSVADLFHTAYGATVAVKSVVVAVMLALGAAARHRVELATALGVLAAAALLVSLLPPV